MSIERRQQQRASQLKKQCDEWNANHPVGTLVNVRKDDGSIFPTETIGPAAVLSLHSAVIHVKGISGCYLLDRVTPRS